MSARALLLALAVTILLGALTLVAYRLDAAAGDEGFGQAIFDDLWIEPSPPVRLAPAGRPTATFIGGGVVGTSADAVGFARNGAAFIAGGKRIEIARTDRVGSAVLAMDQ